MISHETIAVSCPSCGNSDAVDARQATYGYQFLCNYCKTLSVLVINRKLYAPNPGESVCIQCGRVARSGARYCQCGASLFEKCLSCSAEFAVDNRICDACGWPSGVSPTSAEGQSLKVEKARVTLCERPLESTHFEEISRAIFVTSDLCGADEAYECLEPLVRRLPTASEVVQRALGERILNVFCSFRRGEDEDSKQVQALERLATRLKWDVAYLGLAQWTKLRGDAVNALLRCIASESDVGLQSLAVAACAQLDTCYDYGAKNAALVPVLIALLKDGRFRFDRYPEVLPYCGDEGIAALQKLFCGDSYKTAEEAMYHKVPTAVARTALRQMCGWSSPQPAKSRAKEILGTLAQRP